MIDAKFDRIQKVEHHPDADRLDIVTVSNYQCVAKRDEFKVDDWVLYIREDAKLLGWNEHKDWLERDKDAAKTGDFVTQDCFTCTWQWQDGLLKYLGGGGRVKVVRLRGKLSAGILVRPEVLDPNLAQNQIDSWCAAHNAKIMDEQTREKYLAEVFGIGHWSAPTTGFGSMLVKASGLPCGLKKTDEENWENLAEEDLSLGSRALLTKKLDGTSTTITCFPDGHYDISSRSQTFALDKMAEAGESNVYTKFTESAVKAGLWYAQKHNTVIAIRGETCCGSVQNSSYNKDCKREAFFVYSCEFPYEENFYLRYGAYGTDHHFLKVLEEMAAAGFLVNHVPVIDEVTITREMLQSYNAMPWEWGEGVVLNVKVEDINILPKTNVLHYKSKSRDYLAKMK